MPFAPVLYLLLIIVLVPLLLAVGLAVYWVIAMIVLISAAIEVVKMIFGKN